MNSKLSLELQMSSFIFFLDFSERCLHTCLTTGHVSFVSFVDLILDVLTWSSNISSSISAPSVWSPQLVHLIQTAVEVFDLCNSAIHISRWSSSCLHSRWGYSDIIHLGPEVIHHVSDQI